MNCRHIFKNTKERKEKKSKKSEKRKIVYINLIFNSFNQSFSVFRMVTLKLMTDSGQRPQQNAQICGKRERRREDEEREREYPDTHDVNNDRSSFHAILFICFCIFQRKCNKRKDKREIERTQLKDERQETYTILLRIQCNIALYSEMWSAKLHGRFF